MRARLRDFWIRDLKPHRPRMLRAAAAVLAVAVIGYVLLRPAPDTRPAAAAAAALEAAPQLKLDTTLKTLDER